jgi:hypothetical protein
LFAHLENKDGQGKQHQNKHYNCVVGVVIDRSVVVCKRVKPVRSAPHDQQRVDEVTKKESQEVFVVPGPQAVVDKVAVVVVVRTAPVADRAVERAVRLYQLVEDAQVVQVDVVLQKVVNQPNEIELLL